VVQEKYLAEEENRFFCQGEPRILFLPGSRSFAYDYLIPFYKKIADLLLPIFPKTSFALSFPAHYSEKDIPVDNWGEGKIPFYFGKASHLMNQADVAIAIPGSSNLELFYRKKKTLIILPLEANSKNIPLTGIPEFIGKIPGIGPIIKKKILYAVNHKKKWVSLPNIIMNREIFPELRGKVCPEDVVSKVENMIYKTDFDYEISEDEFPTTADSVLTQLIQENFYGKREKSL
jgi:lipid A disaccharide synthetase